MVNQRPHKKLIVWQKSIQMVVGIYELTSGFPKEEEYGLKAQARRAAVSVPSNIAEGLTRKSRKDKVHFLNIADASLSEIDTHLEIALRLCYIAPERFERIQSDLIEVQKLLSGLIRVLR